jgi:AsmA protein
LRRLERKPLSTAQEFAGGRTPFDKLAARLRVSRGTASIEDAQMESALVRVRVLGETSVATRDFDLKGMATLVRASAPAGAAPAFELPFLVVGPWDRPLLLPHPGSLSPFLDAGRRLDHRDKAAAQDEEIERPTDAPTAASAPASETNPSPQ